MAKQAVLIRHLLSHRPVTQAVIDESDDRGVDYMEGYFTDRAESLIRNFVEQFPEFKEARWYLDILSHGNLEKSLELKA